ncbi:MAG: response regulator [Geobacteraceae bacterium]
MNGWKILIVDDEADIAFILKLQLEDVGYRSVRARDGLDALECLEKEPFDLVLLDIKMPRMDGLQTLGRLRRDYRETAVVMMTAHGSEDIAVEAMKGGALDYIAKPFSTDELLDKVERAIRFNRTELENLLLQRQLDEERQKMEAVFQGMPDILVAVDSAGNVMTVNRQMEKILGVDREAIIGRPVTEALHADIPPDQLPCMVSLKNAAPCLGVTYTLRIGMTSIPVLSNATPLFGAAGRLTGSVEIIRDISALKALEQEKEDFVSMLSHDLKTPLTAIEGAIDLVREARLGKVNAEQREYLGSAIDSCNEMVEMIDNLLDVHKFESGKMVLLLKPEYPDELIRLIVSRLRPVAKREKLNISTVCCKSLPVIHVDRAKVLRLLGNLLTNAIKFTSEGGEIEVIVEMAADIVTLRERMPLHLYAILGTTAVNRFLRITVKDSGFGIPGEILESIFDRFVQAENRRSGKTRGSGLGLAFCRKVMDAHHGYIWAESSPGKGSSFVLLFPLADVTGA